MSGIHEHVELFRRQFLQLVNPDSMTLPPKDILKQPEIQAQIYISMFREDRIPFPPPDSYRSRVLKILVKALEDSIEDPEEDEISNDLTAYLVEVMTKPAISEIDQAERKSYVTYSAPASLKVSTKTITTLESPALLAAGGTTGLRTWEAAKYLTSYLCTSDEDQSLVAGSRIIELGAGSALVSMFCAKHLQADFVLATDGTGEVVDTITANMYINNLDDHRKMDAIVLKWGHAITPELVIDEDGMKNYNLVLGADIIFDDRLILPLVSTLHELFEQYSNIQCLIAATIRKIETVEKFLVSCTSRKITAETVSTSLANSEQMQTGLFHSTKTEIKIFKLTKAAV